MWFPHFSPDVYPLTFGDFDRVGDWYRLPVDTVLCFDDKVNKTVRVDHYISASVKIKLVISF